MLVFLPTLPKLGGLSIKQDALPASVNTALHLPILHAKPTTLRLYTLLQFSFNGPYLCIMYHVRCSPTVSRTALLHHS